MTDAPLVAPSVPYAGFSTLQRYSLHPDAERATDCPDFNLENDGETDKPPDADADSVSHPDRKTHAAAATASAAAKLAKRIVPFMLAFVSKYVICAVFGWPVAWPPLFLRDYCLGRQRGRIRR